MGQSRHGVPDQWQRRCDKKHVFVVSRRALCRRGQLLVDPANNGTEVSAETPHVVVGSVYASPSRIQVQGARREAGGEEVVTAYPDICFAVDDSHTGFDTLVRCPE